jgi:hypothetical protein
MPAWYYFARPTNLAFHDLTENKIAPTNIRSLLGLGLKFCPTPRYTTSAKDIEKTLERMERDLYLKVHFAGTVRQDNDINMRMYVKSTFRPDFRLIPWKVRSRMRTFKAKILALFKKHQGKKNLLAFQRNALSNIKTDQRLLVVQCDKNLGPAIITHEAYIARAFKEHLHCRKTYRPLTAEQATAHATKIRSKLQAWIQKYHLVIPSMEQRYLQKLIGENENPWATFYLTMKVHKSPWKTRPIVSSSGTLLFGLGIWVDSQLQKTLPFQKSFFKSSLDLKKLLLDLDIPRNARIFTADAVSMYTNISTSKAITAIAQYLHQRRGMFEKIPVEALIEALKLVMENNVFAFGDTFWHQIDGTAMGTPPAPPYATLFFSIFEATFLKQSSPFSKNLFFYKRFIDDVIAIWSPEPTTEANDLKWLEFKTHMNTSWCGLEWEFSELTNQVDFMDLTISLNEKNQVETTLYEKALNLYLYIPPHSAHPPGVLNGLVLGNIHRMFTLCSTEEKIKDIIKKFWDRLLVRGYKQETIRPLFEAGIARMRARASADPADIPEEVASPDNRVFFHLPFNPGDPSSRVFQKLWRDIVVQPDGPKDARLPNLINDAGHYLGIDRMTVAYSRVPNLGNTLSYRNLSSTGLQASSFMD